MVLLEDLIELYKERLVVDVQLSHGPKVALEGGQREGLIYSKSGDGLLNEVLVVEVEVCTCEKEGRDPHRVEGFEAAGQVQVFDQFESHFVPVLDFGQGDQEFDEVAFW